MTHGNRRAAAFVAALLPLALSAAPAPAAPKPPDEMRCGWYVNPTPGNMWLTDSAGQWIIGTQGGEFADGVDSVPDLTEHDWVVTNGSSYGYGCVCLRVTTDAAAKRITAIHTIKQQPLKVCRADAKLPKP